MDWVEIRDMLGLSITPDQLRKQAVGYLEYDNYINGFEGVSEMNFMYIRCSYSIILPVDILLSYKGMLDTLIINGI